MSLKTYDNFQKLMLLVTEVETNKVVEVLFCNSFKEYEFGYSLMANYLSIADYHFYKVPVGIDMNVDISLLRKNEVE
jgi:hypothetical protein